MTVGIMNDFQAQVSDLAMNLYMRKARICSYYSRQQ
jgi:hypothetical protein